MVFVIYSVSDLPLDGATHDVRIYGSSGSTGGEMFRLIDDELRFCPVTKGASIC